MAGISPKLPISKNKEDGYTLTKTYLESTQQNLKNLLLTVPGERMMDPDFGVGMKNEFANLNLLQMKIYFVITPLEQTGTLDLDFAV